MLAKRLKFLLQADGEGQEEGRNEKRDFGQNLVIKKQVMKKKCMKRWHIVNLLVVHFNADMREFIKLEKKLK